jgi:hypothetical protein
MNEPIPVQPVPIEYAGPGAALGPPIPHRGMSLSTPPPAVGRLIRQVTFGAFYAAALIFILGWWSEEWFPKWSPFRLLLPTPPILGMFLIGAVAQRLSKRESTYAWSIGLWMGGFVLLGLFCVYLIGIGYGGLVAALF